VRLPQPKPAAPPPQQQPWSRPAWTWALAASWLAVAGLGIWVVELKRENTRLTEPSAVAEVAELHVAEPTRGGAELPERPSVSAARPLVLHLDATGLSLHPPYAVEIRAEGAAGPALWRGRAERDPKEKDFTVTLSAGLLPGLYRLRLVGEGEGQAAPPAEFPLEVRAP
jgi:hypothetical protein